MSIYISFNRESFKKPTTCSSIEIQRNPSVFIPFCSIELYTCYTIILNVRTLISYYKKNKFFQFKRKKEVQSWESFLNKRLLELSNNFIRSSTIFNSFYINSLHSIENLSKNFKFRFTLKKKKRNLSSSTIATIYRRK